MPVQRPLNESDLPPAVVKLKGVRDADNIERLTRSILNTWEMAVERRVPFVIPVEIADVYIPPAIARVSVTDLVVARYRATQVSVLRVVKDQRVTSLRVYDELLKQELPVLINYGPRVLMTPQCKFPDSIQMERIEGVPEAKLPQGVMRVRAYLGDGGGPLLVMSVPCVEEVTAVVRQIKDMQSDEEVMVQPETTARRIRFETEP